MCIHPSDTHWYRIGQGNLKNRRTLSQLNVILSGHENFSTANTPFSTCETAAFDRTLSHDPVATMSTLILGHMEPLKDGLSYLYPTLIGSPLMGSNPMSGVNTVVCSRSRLSHNGTSSYLDWERTWNSSRMDLVFGPG